ncbi:hypothetical protein M427DRAFT_63984 [Gonapodya prolifera JEL478]|uniref:Glutathione S-transferase n=1 Tax=Gonapodya prolifera (strain JEL478) TaxID=1344416 RepID=A0A138ZY98_GONPJ|nr:hypothetical protein M427DRAFT_63984 [Gonapodya prolifera JEL478]|eukprot:KXS09476.1 hypothetical protein M427DRAFT_63984 [Gonapodya prolifera JEL478]
MAPTVDYTATSDSAFTNSLEHAYFSSDKPTFFTNIGCPFAQRANLTLLEGNIPFHRVEIDLQNKPKWYNSEVNPRSKVPAFRDLGDEEILIESAILSEYLAEKYATSLIPATPKLRYLGRLLADVQSSAPPIYQLLKIKSDTPEGLAEENAVKAKLLASIKEFTAVLAQGSVEGPFFLGKNVTLPDLITIPILTRTVWLYEYFFGDKLVPDTPEFARFWTWFNALTERPSFKQSFPGVEKLAEGVIKRGFGYVRPGAEKKRQAAVPQAQPAAFAAA